MTIKNALIAIAGTVATIGTLGFGHPTPKYGFPVLPPSKMEKFATPAFVERLKHNTKRDVPMPAMSAIYAAPHAPQPDFVERMKHSTKRGW
jgi:hypothetical protein